jgi:hypothetical protein
MPRRQPVSSWNCPPGPLLSNPRAAAPEGDVNCSGRTAATDAIFGIASVDLLADGSFASTGPLAVTAHSLTPADDNFARMRSPRKHDLWA